MNKHTEALVNIAQSVVRLRLGPRAYAAKHDVLSQAIRTAVFDALELTQGAHDDVQLAVSELNRRYNLA